MSSSVVQRFGYADSGCFLDIFGFYEHQSIFIISVVLSDNALSQVDFRAEYLKCMSVSIEMALFKEIVAELDKQQNSEAWFV